MDLTFLTPLVREVAARVMREEGAPLFFDRQIDQTPLINRAFLCAYDAVFRSVSYESGLMERVAAEVLTLLAKTVGALSWGIRPFVAADSLLLLPGEQLGLEIGSTYGLFGFTADGAAMIPGGFMDRRQDPMGDTIRELIEEVLPGNNPGDIVPRLVVAESSAYARALSRYRQSGLQVISALVLCTPRLGATIKPRAASDNTGWKWLHLFEPNGTPDFSTMSGYVWRDDHFAVIARLLRQAGAFSQRQRFQRNGGSEILRYLESLPEIPLVVTGYRPTPEAEGKYTFPRTYNVQLAEKLVAALLAEYHVGAAKANKVAEDLVGELVAIGFLPYFDGPDPTVDGVVVGSGANANKILLLRDDQGKYFLPGAVVRHGETVLAALQRGLWAKAKMDAAPLHFAGLAPEWPTIDGQAVLRDPRGTSADFLFILLATSPADTTADHLWLRLWDDHGSPNPDLVKLKFRYHHGEVLDKVMRDMVAQMIYSPLGSETLQEAVSRRGLII
ncbi:MAG: hypothetical protein AAB486_00405 [Patescibacteria group bacterium]